MSEVEGALSEGKEVLLLQVVEHKHVARHVRCVRCLLVNEIGGENEFFGADAGSFKEASRLLLDSVDQVVDQPGENLLLVSQQLVRRLVHIGPGYLDDPLQLLVIPFLVFVNQVDLSERG